jgi:LEA14-like dessication related protein
MGYILPLAITLGLLYVGNKVRGLKQITIQSGGIPEIWSITLLQTKIKIPVRVTNASSIAISIENVFTTLSYEGVEFAYNPQKIDKLSIPSRLSSLLKFDYTLDNVSFIPIAAEMIKKGNYKVNLKMVYDVAGVPNTSDFDIDFSAQIKQIKTTLGI